MTLVRRLTTPTGLRHGDHVCWPFSGVADFRAPVVAFLVEGCRRGDVLGRARVQLRLARARRLPARVLELLGQAVEESAA